MAKPVELLSRYHPYDENEGAMHFFARECQLIMRWIVRVLLVVTIGTMITFWWWAIIPATFLLAAYCVLMVCNLLERRFDRHQGEVEPVDASTAAAAPVTAAARAEETAAEAAPLPEWKKPNFRMSLLRHETIIMGAGVFVVFVIAAALAGLFIGWKTVLFATPFVVAYMVLITTPIWFAALEDDIEHEIMDA
jgi:hypothetical protein